MRQRTARIVVFIWITSFLFLQGCATTPSNISFAKNNINTITPLKIVRYGTPALHELTAGRAIGLATTGALLGGGVGAAIALSGKTPKMKASLPDFGQLVMNKFTQRATEEISNFPPMDVEEQPVGEKFTCNNCYLIAFRVEGNGLQYQVGFRAATLVTMKDPAGNIVWQKYFDYYSQKYGRKRSIKEYKADNFNLLMEEMEFAAEKTVLDFIEHFRKGK